MLTINHNLCHGRLLDTKGKPTFGVGAGHLWDSIKYLDIRVIWASLGQPGAPGSGVRVTLLR
jgi:hypothetical protein